MTPPSASQHFSVLLNKSEVKFSAHDIVGLLLDVRDVPGRRLSSSHACVGTLVYFVPFQRAGAAHCDKPAR